MDSGMYTEREMQCVKEGIGAVRSVLSGTDTEAKRRLLFYLDWYMDPYYKQDISGIKNDLKEIKLKWLEYKLGKNSQEFRRCKEIIQGGN